MKFIYIYSFIYVYIYIHEKVSRIYEKFSIGKSTARESRLTAA